MSARRVGLALLGIALVLGGLGPWLAPNPPNRQFRGHLYAPPMIVRVIDQHGSLRWPFVYPLELVDRLERRFEEDRTVRHTLAWFGAGTLVQLDAAAGPLLLLGADELGRDVFSRLLWGARASLGVAVVAALIALMLGAAWGGTAALLGGWTDELLMRVADLVLVLPALYVVLALRAVTPLVLSPLEVFLLMSGVLAVVGWPYVARGVRAIVLSERRQTYTLAAEGLGVGPGRLLRRHLLPASYGFLVTQATLLIPGFMLAEATLSFVGLGFASPSTSWGVMLQESSNVRAMADYPWLLSPALAIVTVVLAVNLAARSGPDGESLAWTGIASREQPSSYS